MQTLVWCENKLGMLEACHTARITGREKRTCKRVITLAEGKLYEERAALLNMISSTAI